MYPDLAVCTLAYPKFVLPESDDDARTTANTCLCNDDVTGGEQSSIKFGTIGSSLVNIQSVNEITLLQCLY